MLRAHSRSNRGIDGPFGRAETVVGGHDRQVARHHAPTTYVRCRHGSCRYAAAAKASCRNAGNALTQPIIYENLIHVGKAISNVERSDSIANIDVGDVDVRYVHHAEAISKTAPPGMEEVTRPYGQPANGAESKPNAEAYASAKSKEGDICRRPNRLIRWVHGAGPPCP